MPGQRHGLSHPVYRLLFAPLLPAAVLGLLGFRVTLRALHRLGNRAAMASVETATDRALRRGDLPAAAFLARRLIEVDRRAPAGYYLLHRAYLRQGKRAKARATLAAALRIAPTDSQLQLALAAFNELGQPHRAITPSSRLLFEVRSSPRRGELPPYVGIRHGRSRR